MRSEEIEQHKSISQNYNLVIRKFGKKNIWDLKIEFDDKKEREERI